MSRFHKIHARSERARSFVMISNQFVAANGGSRATHAAVRGSSRGSTYIGTWTRVAALVEAREVPMVTHGGFFFFLQ